jgi:hypothetical protein
MVTTIVIFNVQIRTDGSVQSCMVRATVELPVAELRAGSSIMKLCNPPRWLCGGGDSLRHGIDRQTPFPFVSLGIVTSLALFGQHSNAL